MSDFSLIPFVCSAGGQVPGSERAGLDLKEYGLIESLKESGIAVDWQQDPAALYAMALGEEAHAKLPPLGSDARKEIVLWHCRHIQEQALQALRAGNVPVTIGGDHAMALGSVSAIARARGAYGRTGLIWVDAHPDLNTPETSPSQAIHGMPVAALMGLGDPDYIAVAGEEPVLDPGKVVYIGLRSIDPGERAGIEEFGITAFTMDDVRRLGVAEVFARAGKIVGAAGAKAISIDLDAFDPAEVPATGSPVPGGLGVEQTLPVLEKLMAAVDFDLIEIAEYNPTLAGRKQTRVFIEKLLKALLLNG